MEILEFFSEQKKKYLEQSFQEDPEEPEELAIANPKNSNTFDKENKN